MRRVQMPPRAITREAYTPAERIGALLVVWSAIITAVSLVVIVLWLVGVIG